MIAIITSMLVSKNEKRPQSINRMQEERSACSALRDQQCKHLDVITGRLL